MKKDNLPHNHHQIFENKSEAIPKTRDFQTVADISNSSETAAGSAYSGFSVTVKNVLLTFLLWWI